MDEFGATLLDDLGLDDDLTIETHPDNSEVTLRITLMELYKSETSGNVSLHVIFDDPDNPETIDDIHNYLGMAQEDDDVKTSKKKRKRMRAFFQCFGISTGGSVDMVSCRGLTGPCILGQEEYNGEMKNTIKRFVGGA